MAPLSLCARTTYAYRFFCRHSGRIRVTYPSRRIVPFSSNCLMALRIVPRLASNSAASVRSPSRTNVPFFRRAAMRSVIFCRTVSYFIYVFIRKVPI